MGEVGFSKHEEPDFEFGSFCAEDFMKNRLIVLTVAVLAFLGGGFVFLKDKTLEIDIPQDKIDAALSEKFPVKKEYLLLFNIEYKNPQVTLLEEDDKVRVGLDAMLQIRLPGESKELVGGATLTCGLRYEPETKEFYLDEAKFDRLEIEGIPEKYLDKVSEVASIAATEFVERWPVYRLEGEDLKMSTAKLLLQGLEVENKTLIVTLGL